MSAAARARRLDRSLEIIVLEKGPTPSYSACGLPYFVEGQVRKLDDLLVHPAEYFARERNIAVRTGVAVTAISHARREVATSIGERVHYDKLVIATGARVDDVPLPGIDPAIVFRLQTLADAGALRSFILDRRPRRAVIV